MGWESGTVRYLFINDSYIKVWITVVFPLISFYFLKLHSQKHVYLKQALQTLQDLLKTKWHCSLLHLECDAFIYGDVKNVLI